MATIAYGMPIHPTDNMMGSQPLDEQAAFHSLARLGMPRGLAQQVIASTKEFPVRFWVVDNSGSMNVSDGNRLVSDGVGKVRRVTASRWNELSDTILGIGELATALGARTDFHLLNGTSQGQAFSIADDGTAPVGKIAAPVDLKQLQSKIRSISPSGSTPLTESVLSIVSLLEPAADKLRARGQKAVVVLATDGMPNDKASFLQALRELQRLPIWLVVRLCTDDDAVVEYWNELDGALEVEMEVLDDEYGEAAEVHGVNGWLSYGPPLHRAREFGLHHKIFDLLDEQPLVPSQQRQFCEAILGCGQLPEPEADLRGFRAAVQESLSGVAPVFDPVSRSMKPWVNASRLCKKKSGLFSCFT